MLFQICPGSTSSERKRGRDEIAGFILSTQRSVSPLGCKLVHTSKEADNDYRGWGHRPRLLPQTTIETDQQPPAVEKLVARSEAASYRYSDLPPFFIVTQLAIEHNARPFFTREQAALWAGGSGDRLNALLKRGVNEGEIARVRNGIYILSERFNTRKIDPLQLAQLIYGPSYVSLESALSYHGWIPEGVRTITSVTLKRSRSFETPLGIFSYTRIPQLQLFSGIRRIANDDRSSFFLAIPLKALADYVYVHGHRWRSAQPVVESLRIDEQVLKELKAEHFDEVSAAYRPGRVRRFLNALKADLSL